MTRPLGRPYQCTLPQGDRPESALDLETTSLLGDTALHHLTGEDGGPGWLKVSYPNSPEMPYRTSYRTPFVQSRGALRKELTRYLRTGRVIRRPKAVRLPDGRGGRRMPLAVSPGRWCRYAEPEMLRGSSTAAARMR